MKKIKEKTIFHKKIGKRKTLSFQAVIATFCVIIFLVSGISAGIVSFEMKKETTKS